MFRKFGIFAIIVIAFVAIVKVIRLALWIVLVLADLIVKLINLLFPIRNK